jgi:hypothetical protein
LAETSFDVRSARAEALVERAEFRFGERAFDEREELVLLELDMSG